MGKHSYVPYNTVALFSSIAKALTPPPKLNISDWADRYRMLSPEASALAGHWDTSVAEYQREIMNAISDPVCSRIVVMTSSQVGKTEILLNALGYYVDYDPSPIMILQPTDKMVEAFSKDRIAPMIRDTPVLKEKIKDARARDSDNTITHKKFPGGHVTIAGTNSPSNLASRPIRILMCDEIDRYPDSSGGEGNPLKLAEKRTISFWNKKIIMTSTPTIEGASKVQSEYLAGSREEWCVKCPCCGEYQPYEFRRIRFSDVAMQCLYCEEYIPEMEWKRQPHKWMAEFPERRNRRSFHMNELAVSWVGWEDVIEEYRQAMENKKLTGSTKDLQVFINTALGETWKLTGKEKISDNELLERREEYPAELPDGVVLITASVDVQDERLEIERVGWARHFESWGLYKEVIPKSPALDSTWDELEELLDSKLHFQSGQALQVAATCVDTGGHHTNQTYKWLKKMQQKQKNIFGIKGYASVPGIPLIYKRTDVKIKNNNGKVVDSIKIFILGVDAGKDDVISRLNIKEPGPGYCHFPLDETRGYDEAYMKGLNSEQKVMNMVNGKYRIKWQKKSAGVRNEPLDLRNYAYAAHELLNPRYDVLEKKVANGINYMERNVSEQNKKKHRKRGILNRGVEV